MTRYIHDRGPCSPLILTALASILIALTFFVPPAPVAAAENTQKITLADGFNFISFTVSPQITAAGLKELNPFVEDIYLYSAAAGTFLSLNEGTLNSISAYKGYILRSRGAQTIYLNGAAPTVGTVSTINLKPGFNLVGFSIVPERITFSQLMTRSRNISGIYQWSAASGAFIQVLSDGVKIISLDGIDPVITQGRSYFIRMNEEATMNYNGAAIQLSQSAADAVISFMPAPGEYETVRLISLSCNMTDASIYYTTNGSEPGLNSLRYSAPFPAAKNTTIRAAAFKNNILVSKPAEAKYLFKMPAPVFETNAGIYTGHADIIIKASAGAKIYYTSDESVPGENSTLYTAPIVITESKVIKAIAVSPETTASNISKAEYYIKAARPLISPAAGSFDATVSVSISSETANADIYYTADGSAPTTASSVFKNPVLITQSTVIKAVVIKNKMLASDIVTASFIINIKPATPPIVTPPIIVTPPVTPPPPSNPPPPVVTPPPPPPPPVVIPPPPAPPETAAAPVLSPASCSFVKSQTVTIGSATSGAAIYYTIDDSTPTASSALYTGAIKLDQTATVKAIAVKSGMTSSAVSTSTYTNVDVREERCEFLANGNLMLTWKTGVAMTSKAVITISGAIPAPNDQNMLEESDPSGASHYAAIPSSKLVNAYTNIRISYLTGPYGATFKEIPAGTVINLAPQVTNENAVKETNGDIRVSWQTNYLTAKTARVTIRGPVPAPGEIFVNENANPSSINHFILIPAAMIPANYEKLRIGYYISDTNGVYKDILRSAVIDLSLTGTGFQIINEQALMQPNGDVIVSWRTNIAVSYRAKIWVKGAMPMPDDKYIIETNGAASNLHSVTIPAAVLGPDFTKLRIGYYYSDSSGIFKDIPRAAIANN